MPEGHIVSAGKAGCTHQFWKPLGLIRRPGPVRCGQTRSPLLASDSAQFRPGGWTRLPSRRRIRRGCSGSGVLFLVGLLEDEQDASGVCREHFTGGGPDANRLYLIFLVDPSGYKCRLVGRRGGGWAVRS